MRLTELDGKGSYRQIEDLTLLGKNRNSQEWSKYEIKTISVKHGGKTWKKITEYGKEKKTPSTPIKQFEKKI